jgi:hypothetical protein
MVLGGEWNGIEIGELVRFVMTLGFALIAWGFETRTEHIPNALTLGGLLPAVAVALLFGRGQDALAGAALAFIPAYMVFRYHLIAGGAVKTALLLGASGGIVVGAVLGTAAALVGLVRWGQLVLAERRKVKLMIEPPIRSTPRLFVIALVGLILHHLWAV